MNQGVVGKIGLAVLTLLITLILVFILLRVVPNNPAEVMLGADASPEAVREVTELWGLDKPLAEQFGIYVLNLLRGDTGISFTYTTPGSAVGVKVWDIVMSRLPYTFILAVTSLALAVVIAIPLGVLSAMRADSLTDHAIGGGGVLLMSMPSFWLGLILVEVFALRLDWLPSGGTGGIQHLVLPSFTLAAGFIVLLTRVTRTEVLRVMRSDYIRTARAKGLPDRTVVWRHALRNALIPLVTLIGLRLGTLLNGAVVVEAVFRWPGLGTLMLNSIGTRDYPTIQFLVPLTAVMFIALNFLTDFVYALVDPRVAKTTR